MQPAKPDEDVPAAILVTGADGQLGRALQRCSTPGNLKVVALNRAELDLRDTRALAATIEQREWAAVINAAAYTSVDAAQSDVVAAWAVNALAPAALGAACARHGIPLLQVSTDYVFSGEGSAAWQPQHPTDPQNVYGASKLGGELAVRTTARRHIILRTSWVISAHGRNFVTTMLRLAQTHEEVSVVADQHGGPTSAADLAQTLLAVAARMVVDASAPTGIYHFSNAGAVTWADLAQAIFMGSRRRGGPWARVRRVPSSEYQTAARRPSNSRLCPDALRRAYGIAPRGWEDALEEILDELIGPVL